MRPFEPWHAFKVAFCVTSAVSLLAGCQTVNTELAMLFGETPTPPIAAAVAESSDDTPKNQSWFNSPWPIRSTFSKLLISPEPAVDFAG
jgi:hypothetical protein